MSICITSTWNNQFNDIARIVVPNFVSYAKKHDYQYRLGECSLPRTPQWWKVLALKESLETADVAVWLDTDLIITNLETKIEQFLCGDTDLIFSHDINGLNIGVLIVRKTPSALQFLEDWWRDGERYQHHVSPEQAALAYLLYRYQRVKWSCLPQRSFNSYHYNEYKLIFPEGEWQPGDFILHLPGIPNKRRIDIFKEHGVH